MASAAHGTRRLWAELHMTEPEAKRTDPASVDVLSGPAGARAILKSPWAASLASGAMAGTSFIPFPPWAIFFCFAPLWWAWLNATSWRQVAATGWLTQFVLALIGFVWVGHTAHEFGHLSWGASVLALLGYASICTPHIPLAGVVWWFFCRTIGAGTAVRLLILPAFVMAGERVTPTIFEWHFGYTWFWADFPAFQLADIVGFIGLSSIGLAFNGMIVAGLVYRRHRLALAWPFAVVALFGLLNVVGYWRGRISPAPPDAVVRMLIVQPMVANEDKSAVSDDQRRDDIVMRLVALTDEGLARYSRIDFAIWPETAFPDFVDDPEMRSGRPLFLRHQLAGMKTTLISGGYGRQRDTGRQTNALFVAGGSGLVGRRYDKSVLLPFGEYFPGANWLHGLREKFPEIGELAAGPGPSVIAVDGVRIGAQICYEGLFDWFSRKLANDGAQVLVNITNDSWFGSVSEPYQHAYMTFARAIEVRRPLIRATNSGISAAILGDGRILPPSPLFKPWVGAYELPYVRTPAPTPFMTWGYWLIPFLIGSTLLGSAVGTILARRRDRGFARKS